MTARKHTNPATPSDPASQAAEALARLKELTANLEIDDAIPPNQLAATRVVNRVPLKAMTIAAGVLADDPAQFPQFDAADAQAALAYEQAMVPVARAAQELANRITKSVLKRRSEMARSTLALYQVMKGTSRLTANEQTRMQVKELSKLFTTKRKARETDVSQKETDAFVRTRKSEKKQAAAEAKRDDAVSAAAIASARAALEAAVAEGTVPQVVASAANAPPATASSAPVVATGPAEVAASGL
jgi:hypothetical protein